MTLSFILILALIQGLTEFLPVSSSAHLVLAQHFLGIQEPVLTLDVILHGGTLVAVFIFYRKDLAMIFRDIGKTLRSRDWRAALSGESGVRILFLITLATIPTGVIGLAFHDQFEQMFSGLGGLGESLMLTGIFLWFSGTKAKTAWRGIQETPWWMALVIGVVQGISIIPGISRSGSTIVAALFLGLTPSWAARFSFLMCIPAILGAVVVEMSGSEFTRMNGTHLFLGFCVALVVGIVTLKWVVQTLARGTFRYFGHYVFILGLITCLYYWFSR